MIYIILLFGFFIMLAGIAIIAKPEFIISQSRRHSESLGLYISAIVARLALGAALLIYAGKSNYPIFLEIFGWLLITTAIILAVMGRSRFNILINWVLRLMTSYRLFVGLLAILLGGFLILWGVMIS